MAQWHQGLRLHPQRHSPPTPPPKRSRRRGPVQLAGSRSTSFERGNGTATGDLGFYIGFPSIADLSASGNLGVQLGDRDEGGASTAGDLHIRLIGGEFRAM